MLSQCGMALLDPHNPFDFLVLQSLRLEGEDESISWRMERFLGSVFRSKDAAYIEARGKGRISRVKEEMRKGNRRVLPAGFELNGKSRIYTIESISARVQTPLSIRRSIRTVLCRGTATSY